LNVRDFDVWTYGSANNDIDDADRGGSGRGGAARGRDERRDHRDRDGKCVDAERRFDGRDGERVRRPRRG
jgi:hypothetical protein